MKTAVYILLASFAISIMPACKKPKQELTQSMGFGFVNNSDKDVTVRIYSSYSKYTSDKKPTGDYQFDISAGKTLVAPIVFGDYYIDWFSTDREYSNWGIAMDQTFNSNVANAITFKFSDKTKEYYINTYNVRPTFLDTGGRTIWSAISGIKDGVEVKKSQIVKLNIYKNYSVSVQYSGGKSYALGTSTFSNNMILTDSISQQYSLSVLSGVNRFQDTLLLKLPYTDTIFKMVKTSIL